MALHQELATNKPLHLDEFKNVLVLGAGALFPARKLLTRLLRKLWNLPCVPPRNCLTRCDDLVRPSRLLPADG